MSFESMSNKEIIKEAMSYYDLIHGVNACYGVKDVLYLRELLNELTNRGIQFEETQTLTIEGF